MAERQSGGRLYPITDGFYIGLLLLKALLGMLLDRVLGITIPRAMTDITAGLLTRFLRRKVNAVALKKSLTLDANKDDDSERQFGAGGTGTIRAQMAVAYADGTDEHLFVKLPASTLFERLFLTIFSVYSNELHFYQSVYEKAPKSLFAAPLAVAHSAYSGTFCLILEDLCSKGVRFYHIMAEYPKERLLLSLRSFAILHAAFWNRPPAGVWCDDWSRGRTVPPTPTATLPPWRRIIGEATLKQFLKRYPGLIPSSILSAYRALIARMDEVSEVWSSAINLTLVHGDGHYGNMFFKEDLAGFIDMQCVAVQHPMRDVAYHLLSSCDAEFVEENLDELLDYYLGQLNERGVSLPKAEAMCFYRLHSWWALAQFVISAGANDLMVGDPVQVCISRICAGMEAVDAVGALAEVLGLGQN